MQFNVNGALWSIKLVSKQTLLSIFHEAIEDEETNFCYGMTSYPYQTIYINAEMEETQQIKTLKHELAHCYIWNSGLYNVPNYTEEMVCDVISCSNNFINEIVELFKMYIENQKIKED